MRYWVPGMHRVDRGYTLEEARAAVGPGWRSIAERAWRLAAELGAPVLQVKEKMGGLRVYVAGDSRAAVYAAVEPLEAESLRTCEWCARPGELRDLEYQEAIFSHGHRTRIWWQKTLCDDHAWRFYVDGERWDSLREWEWREG